jgi:hypothetical protein
VLRIDLPSELNRLVLGDRERIAGTVYGTIVVLASLTAGASANEHDLWQLDAIIGVSVVILWLAHVYSQGLGESLDSGRRLTAPELAAIARRELSIPLAAVLPMTVIALGALDVFQHRTALWLALGSGVATLTAQGVRYAQLEHLSRTATIGTVALNLVLGLVIVALKAIVVH